MSRLSFDELNAFDLVEELENGYLSDSEYGEYFDAMEISEEEKQKRISFAKKFEDTMLFIFALYLIMRQYGHMNEKYIISQLQSKYSEIASEYMKPDKHTKDYIRKFSKETIDVTKRHDGEEYFTSRDRAIILSQNEANTSLNYAQYADALRRGCTKKKWITEKDNRVRETHREVDDIIIPIEGYFPVGDRLMLYPHDAINGSAEEVTNCRCSIKYLK